jgi:hypothetical protein
MQEKALFTIFINGYQGNISLVGTTVGIYLRNFSKMKILTAEFSPDNIPKDIPVAETPH